MRSRLVHSPAPALLSALLLLLALPPCGLWPIALVALVPLLGSLRMAPVAQAIRQGWLCGFVLNLAGLRWIYPLMERVGQAPGGHRLIGIGLLAAYQACVFALLCGAGSWFSRRARVPWLVAAPLAGAVAEHALPFLFPWGLSLFVWRAWPLLQVAEIGGGPAVSALVVLFNLTVLEAGLALRRRVPIPRAPRIAFGVILGLLSAGALRVGHVARARGSAPRVMVGIVLPHSGAAMATGRLPNGDLRMAELRRATADLARSGAALVVWPESAFPFLFDRRMGREYSSGHPWALRGGFTGALLFGTLSHAFGGASVYNSAVLVAPDGAVAAVYDKRRLFPFGEYVPLAGRFPRWAGAVRERLPFSPEITPGDKPELLVSGNLRIAPLICYEDLFPELVAEMARRSPNLLVTLSNHVWFVEGASSEYAMALSTLRSVETRRDLVRAVSSGVSSVGDALGRVHVRSSTSSPVGAPNLLSAEVVLLEMTALGPYLVPLFPWACALLLALLTLKRRWRKSEW